EERELPVDELKSMILQAGKETYGDALVEATLHPYMWASKVHYYLPDLAFYNWPYTFGMLFSLALYRKFSDDPGGFVPEYDRLLADTGVATPADLAARFGLDVRSEAFWRSSLDVIRQRITEFEAAAALPAQVQG
ncbi:MAG: M3 family oligoendopeptidase, partial [Actinomycetota bacterium]